MSTFTDNDFCFACGTKNPLGLQLLFYTEGELFCTRFTAQPQWQGFTGILHGGLQATILDDLMSNHLFRIERIWATTTELSVRFRKPVPLGSELLYTSRVVSHRGKLWELESTCMLYNGDGSILSSARGRFMEVPRQTPN